MTTMTEQEAIRVLRAALAHAESVYRLNVVKDGEPSSTLQNMQDALAATATIQPVAAPEPVYQWRPRPIGGSDPAWHDAKSHEKANMRAGVGGEARTLYTAAPVQANPIEVERADFEDWFTSRFDEPLQSRECASKWSAWLARSTGFYKARTDWKVSPQPWGPSDDFPAAAPAQALTHQQIADHIDRPGFALDNLSPAEQRNLLASIAELLAAPAQAATDAVRELYTCIGKGGTYSLIGKPCAAGSLRGVLISNDFAVYRDIESGMLFVRLADDFDARMERIATAQAATGEAKHADQA